MTSAPRRIVLLGAARSGTKLLRDLIAEAAGVGAVPYDISFAWKDGQQSFPHDVLDPSTATAERRGTIAAYVDRYAAAGVVVEKTVGNALRVPFVHAVLPDAAFVQLVRDGVDTIESTMRQWQAPADRAYLLAKLRHFPLRALPTYGVSFLRAQVRRDGSDHVRSWGVRYPGIDNDVRSEDLLTVCARQWVESVRRPHADLAALSLPVTEVRYESLVASPAEVLGGLLETLALPTVALASAVDRVRADRTGVGASALSASELAVVHREAGAELARLRYRSALER